MISGSVADGIHYTVKNDEKELFNNWNIGGMSNGPSSNPSFTISSPAVITYVDTYHWNYRKGKKPGTIALKHSDGTIYGPWDAYSPPGSAIDVYWTVEPNVKIKAGTYKIIDSDPKTWSYNSQSKNQGFEAVKALKSSDSSKISPMDTPGKIKPSSGIIGTYKTAWGDLVLDLKGNTVTGNYPHDKGKISGTISGNFVSGTWSEAPTYTGNVDSGKFVWTFTDDFSAFSGTYGYGKSSNGGAWSGTKK